MVVQLVMWPGIKQTCDFGRFGNRTPTFRAPGLSNLDLAQVSKRPTFVMGV